VPARPVTSPPAPAPSAEPAKWLSSRISLFGPLWVTSTVGTGWPAYARIFHPLDDTPDALRWADIAHAHGHTMHAGAQWHVISSDKAQSPFMGRGYPGDPEEGALRPHALAALCQILKHHTATPDRCWFAVWEGWGWMHPGAHSPLFAPGAKTKQLPQPPDEWQLDLTGPKFTLPARGYHLFTGPIQAATRTGNWLTPDSFHPQSPSLFWPDDHAWCVSTEVDRDSTLVAGTPQLIDAITASPVLEALPIAHDEPANDTLNA